MTVWVLRVALGVAILFGVAAPAGWAQTGVAASAVNLDQLPKHPIPYRVLRGRLAPKPRHPAVQAGAKATQSPTPAASPTVGAAHPPATFATTVLPNTPAPQTAGLKAPPSPPAAGSSISTAPTAQPLPRPPPTVVETPTKPAAPLPPPPPPLPAPQIGAELHPQDALPAADLAAYVDGQISAAMALNHINGMTVAIVQNGQLVLEKGFAGPDAILRRKLDPRASLVRLGSASQILTWIAVMKAIEEGRLKLDDSINTHLSEALKVPDEGFDHPVLLRHLLSQSAGFEDRALGRRYVLDPDRLLPLEEALRRFRPHRVRAAGLLSIPSDYSVALAGEAAAKAEGLGFDQMIESKILLPLGLTHTSFREPYPAREGLPDPLDATLAANIASGFRWTPDGLAAQPFAYGQSLAPGVAASTTADDMARLMIALLSNGHLGSATLYGPTTAGLIGTPSQHPAGGMQGWGHGLALMRLPSGPLALFDLGTSLTFQSQIFLVPQMNLGIFVAADTDTGAAAVAGFPPALIAKFYGGTSTSPSPVPPSTSQMDVAGSYLSAQRTYHGLEAFADRLTLGSSVRLNPASGGLVIRAHGQVSVFAPAGPDLYRAWDGAELFLSDVKNRAQAYILGSAGGGAQRVDRVHTLGFLAAFAASVLLASLASFSGLFTRDRTDQRETRSQTAANAVQIATCVVWCLALCLFGLFLKNGAGPSALMFDWPNRWLVVASWAALTAAILSLATAVQVPGVWREGRRIQGWSLWRKIRHTGTVILFIAFSALLGAWGALEPWSS